MAPRIYLVAVFAVILAATTVHGLHFPRGKTLVYKYYGNVKTGTANPTPYASEFTLEGTLYLKHDTSDPIFINAYYVALLDVKTSMYNGEERHKENMTNLSPIDEMASVLQQPFMMFYDENGTFRAVQILEDEAGWSKNMKMAMASMLQLDLAKIDMQTPEEHQTFSTNENTIHGDCSVVYDVERKGQHPAKEFIIKKVYSPKNCIGFEINNFNQRVIDNCLPITEERITGESKRIVEIEREEDDIIIKKLSAYGDFNYLPAYKMSDAHYVLTNTTFTFERAVPVSEIHLPFVDFRNERITHNMTYQKAKGRYASNTAMDLTQGRHFVNPDTLVNDLKKMLEEAVDYIEKNQLDMEAPDWIHGHSINKILDTMSYMDLPSLELVFKSYQNYKRVRNFTIMNFFCNIIAQVGTPATSLFSLRIITNRKIMEQTAVAMLENLAFNVKEPTEELLGQMEDLLKLNETVGIKRAGILSFSTLMYRTFKHSPHPEKNTLLQHYLHDFFNRVKSEEDYGMKVVYLMAIRNVEVGNIHDLLTPIIEGDLEISKNPENIRLLAIWAVEKAISKDYLVAEKLLWPIMTDKILPVKLRIAAYEIMIHIPNDVLLRRIYWFMVMETNAELRNYHHTTLENIAKSSDPCKADLRTLLGKIVIANNKQEHIFFTRSAAYYYDSFHGVGEKLRAGVIFDDVSRTFEVGQFEYSLVGPSDAVIDMGIRLNVQGLGNLPSKAENFEDSRFFNPLEKPGVLEMLKKAARGSPPSAELHIDFVLMRKGRVVMAYHYDQKSYMNLVAEVLPYLGGQRKFPFFTQLQSVEYEQMSQMQVTNDLGLPVILHSRAPVVFALNVDSDKGRSESFAMEYDISIDLKIWKHGEHALSTYNPIADAWHSVRRTTAMDISLPLQGTLTQSPLFVKFNFLQLPPEKIRVAGFLQSTKDSVTVTIGKDSADLKKSCGNCDLQEDIIVIDDFAKPNFNGDFLSVLTGRQYTYSTSGCSFVENLDVPDMVHWFDSNSTMIHQKFASMLLYPQVGICYILLDARRSRRFPTSGVRIRFDSIGEAAGNNDATGYVLNPKKHEFYFNIDAISNLTDTSLTSWLIKGAVSSDDGYLSNHLDLQMIVKVPDKQDYKICIEANKSYQRMPWDRLKIDGDYQESNSDLTIAAGYGNSHKCFSYDIMVTITMKGELSKEQKEKLDRDSLTGRCSKDIKNPLYPNTNREVPMTLNCLNEAITYSSLRKYNINLTQKSVPHQVLPFMMTFYDKYLRSAFSAYYQLNIERLDAENLRIIAEFPMQLNGTDDNDLNKTEESSPGGIQLTDLRDVDNDIAEPLWLYPLDNTRFSKNFLSQYTDKNMKICVIYPRIILTADHKTIPFNVPREWTLITGDHFTKKFAIFAKAVGDKLSTKIYVEREEVVIFPSLESGFQVMINGLLLPDELEDDVLVPDDNKDWILKLTRKNRNHLMIVHFNKISSLSMVYSPDYMTLYMDRRRLEGKVCGLCGRLDGTNSTDINEIYTLT